MVSTSGGRVTLTKAERDVVVAVRDAAGRVESGSRIGSYTRGGETVTLVGPDRIVKRLQRAGVLRIDVGGGVHLVPQSA